MESCPKLSHVNRILKCRTKYSKRNRVEPQLRGDVLCSRGGVGWKSQEAQSKAMRAYAQSEQYHTIPLWKVVFI